MPLSSASRAEPTVRSASAASGAGHKLDGRCGNAGRREHASWTSAAEGSDPCLHQVGERVGQRRVGTCRLDRPSPLPARGHRTGFPARPRKSAPSHASTKIARAVPIPLAQTAKTQRTQADSTESPRAWATAATTCTAPAAGIMCARFRSPHASRKAPGRECDDLQAGGVKPLQIVDCQQYRRRSLQLLDQRQEARSDRTRVRRRHRLRRRATARDPAPAAVAPEAPPMRRNRHRANKSANAAYASTDSASAARADNTRNPASAAESTAANHTVVLPIPASPSMTHAEGHADVEPKKSATACDSAGRPKTLAAIMKVIDANEFAQCDSGKQRFLKLSVACSQSRGIQRTSDDARCVCVAVQHWTCMPLSA